MKRKILCLMTALILLMGAVPAGAGGAPVRFQTTLLDLFDTVTYVMGYAESRAAFDEEVERFTQSMRTYNALFDIYNDYEGVNNLKTVNDAAGGEPVSVSKEMIDFLLFAREVAVLTAGRVDVTLGAVLNVWHEAREYGIAHPDKAYLPDAEVLAEAARHTGMDLLQIDPEACTVRLTDPEARLDVGALAKGYAAELSCRDFPEGYLISVGGNVLVHGAKPDGAKWTVGVTDPFDPYSNSYLATLSMTEGSVVTSGDYQRFYTVDGVNYHHIIDPDTLMPARRYKAVTIICADSGIGDALSTALYLMSAEDALPLLEKYDAEAMWVEEDGNVFWTTGFKTYLPFTQ